MLWPHGRPGLLKMDFPVLMGLQTPRVPLPVPSLPAAPPARAILHRPGLAPCWELGGGVTRAHAHTLSPSPLCLPLL